MGLRIAFFGTPDFATPTLEALLASRHTVAGAVAQPDRPKGRGQKLATGPVKALALAHRVPVLQPERLARELFEKAFRALGADLGVVVAYGKMLPDWLLATPRLGFINVHASLLPAYRGASPIHHAIMAGDHETGVTIMRVVKALDAGAMLASVRTPIGPDDTTAELEPRLAQAGARLLVDVVDRLEHGPIDEVPQDESRATYAPRLTKDDGRIDWTWRAQRIHDLVRALHPWPHAFTFVGAARIIVHRTRVAAERTTEPPGTLVGASGSVRVACGDGLLLELLVLQAEGGRALEARAFVAGHPMPGGTRLTPT
jgi:methionyl-tRNA formyltransferase